MSRFIVRFAVAMTLGYGACGPALAEDAPEAVQRIVSTLRDWGTNSVLVDAVRHQNARQRALAEIQRIDAEWMAATGVTPFMQELLTNPAAQELQRLERSQPYFTEMFLMDDQGANVAMTNKTSDYWQGDEDKFRDSFRGGQGGVEIGEVKFDTSAQAYLVQVSVPVMDAGAAIGAITVGIDLDRLESEDQQ